MEKMLLKSTMLVGADSISSAIVVKLMVTSNFIEAIAPPSKPVEKK
jgi:hypothetical protein